jgi:hypothetical protein
MFEFLNLALAGGLAAAAAPIVIHLMRRRKVKPVEWGAMRFLAEVLAKSRRRLFLDELLLLLVRTLIVALVALALLRPALKRERVSSQDTFVRYGRTAAVLLIDDSLSTSAGRGESAMDAMKQLALAYLNTLAPGDEVSVLRRSQLRDTQADPLFDLEAARAIVTQLKPTAVASDVPALLEAGVTQLRRHINPSAELVLVTDCCADGWHADDHPRWDEVRLRLMGPPGATPGTRQRPHLLVLSPEAPAAQQNLAVTGVRLDRTLVSVGRPVGIRVELSHFGKEAPPSATLRFLVDSRPMGEKPFTIAAGGNEEIIFNYTFSEPGAHFVTAQIDGARDSLPLDDTRWLAVQVEQSVPVLLVEGKAGAGFNSSLGFVAAALDPEGGGRGPFQLTRVIPAQLTESVLQTNRVVILGDAPALSAEALDALERHVVSGGGVLVGVGSQTDPALVNRLWAKAGSGFLPTALGDLAMTTNAAGIGAVNAGHPVFSGFGARPGEAWKEGKVRGWFRLDATQVKAGELDKLLALDTGDALLVERRRGLGLAALWTSSLNADWNDLPVLPAFVPLVRSVVGHLGSFVLPPRNLLPGEPLSLTSTNDAASAVAEGPDGRPVKLIAGAWEGRAALVSEPLLQPGGYTVRAGNQVARYAVATDPEESRLVPVAETTVKASLGTANFRAFSRGEQVTQALSAANRRSIELWRWLLVACLVFLFVETFLTRREMGAVLGGTAKLAR